MDEGIAAADLAQQVALGRLVEEGGVLLGNVAAVVEDAAQPGVLQIGQQAKGQGETQPQVDEQPDHPWRGVDDDRPAGDEHCRRDGQAEQHTGQHHHARHDGDAAAQRLGHALPRST